MTVLLLAFRNLRRQRRRTFFTGLMMAGGFFLLSVFIGMTEGSYATIIDFFTRDHAGHLQIHRTGYLDEPALYLTLEDWPKLSGRLSLEGAVTAFCPRLYASALVFNGPKTVGVRCTGVDPEAESRASRLSHKVTRGRYFPAIGDMDALVGDGLAKTLGLEVGSTVALVSQGADGSVANDLFTVVGIVGSEGGGGDSQDFYLRLSDAQKFLNLEGRFHEVAVLLKDIRLSRKVSLLLARRLSNPTLDVQPWQVVESDFYKAMSVDKKGNIVSYLIFLLLVAFGVLNTVLMNLLERVPEYGLLKALGTRPSTLAAMILLEMSLLALLSMVPAAALAWAVNAYLAHQGIPIPTTFTYGGMVFGALYGEVSWKIFLIPFALVLGVSVLVCVPAAWRVWRLTPREALRRA